MRFGSYPLAGPQHHENLSITRPQQPSGRTQIISPVDDGAGGITGLVKAIVSDPDRTISTPPEPSTGSVVPAVRGGV
jgi:hypothetical protein